MKYLKHINEKYSLFTTEEINNIKNIFYDSISDYDVEYFPNILQRSPSALFKNNDEYNKICYYYIYNNKSLIKPSISIHLLNRYGRYIDDMMEDIQNVFVPQMENLGYTVNIDYWYHGTGMNLPRLSLNKITIQEK